MKKYTKAELRLIEESLTEYITELSYEINLYENFKSGIIIEVGDEEVNLDNIKWDLRPYTNSLYDAKALLKDVSSERVDNYRNTATNSLRNYIYVMKQEVNIIEIYIEDEIGPDTHQFINVMRRKRKETLQSIEDCRRLIQKIKKR